jgi:hypothetical protein
MWLVNDHVAYLLAKQIMEERQKEAEIYQLLKAANSGALRLRDRFLLSIGEFLISLGGRIKNHFESKRAPQYSNPQVCLGDAHAANRLNCH